MRSDRASIRFGLASVAAGMSWVVVAPMRQSPASRPMSVQVCRMDGMIPAAAVAQQQDQQDAEKVRQLRSRLIEILNGDPAASLTRRRAQTWCSLFVAPCAPEGTPPVSTRLWPCWTTFEHLTIGQEWMVARDTAMADQSDRALKPVFWSTTANAASVSLPRRALNDWRLTRMPPRYGWFRIRAKRPSRPWGRAIGQVVPTPPSWSVLTGRLPVGSMPFWPSCRASRAGGSSQSS